MTYRAHTTRGSLFVVASIIAGLGLFGSLWARAGDLEPPAGPVAPTGRTLSEIFDRIGALESDFGVLFGSSDRELILIEGLGSGLSTTVAGSGRAIVHSVTVQTGRARIVDNNGVDTGLVYAHAVHRPEGLKYDSSYQVMLNVELELPFTVTNTAGTSQSAALQIVMTRLSPPIAPARLEDPGQ